jgi:4-amino-4-deoxy-L-arabinose transferase-like glycosyltransferase
MKGRLNGTSGQVGCAYNTNVRIVRNGRFSPACNVRRNTYRWTTLSIVIIFVGAHVALVVDGSQRNSPVVDEIGHIPAGLSHWELGTYTAYSVNPPLARMVAALPLLFSQHHSDYRYLTEEHLERPEFYVGMDFANSNRERFLALVRLARLPGIVWSLLTAWIVFRWSRELYGECSGCLAVALWCLEPFVIAFTQVVTPDICSACTCVLATYLFWHYLTGPSQKQAWACGAALGIAQLSKFSLLVMYAVWPLMWIIAVRSGQRQRVADELRASWVRDSLIIITTSLFIINMGYRFQGAGLLIKNYDFRSDLLKGEPPAGVEPEQHSVGNRFRGTWLEWLPIPVPFDYVSGMDLQLSYYDGGFSSYLGGEIRHHGWWYYYVWALGVKLPIGFLCLAAWGIVLPWISGWNRWNWTDEALLILPALMVLMFVSSQTGYSNHLRYVLPMVPFAVISASKLARYWRRNTSKTGMVVAVLLIWMISVSIAIHPHQMSYFNEAAGGPENGGAHLLVSNIDWGQDLLFLKEWLNRHSEAKPLGLAYYTCRFDPRIIGIEFHLPPPCYNGLFSDDMAYTKQFGPHPGWYAISVNYLRGLGFEAPDGHGGWRRIPLRSYEYFRHFRPVAQAGYSIYIYQISMEQANEVRKQLGITYLD